MFSDDNLEYLTQAITNITESTRSHIEQHFRFEAKYTLAQLDTDTFKARIFPLIYAQLNSLLSENRLALTEEQSTHIQTTLIPYVAGQEVEFLHIGLQDTFGIIIDPPSSLTQHASTDRCVFYAGEERQLRTPSPILAR